jgi:site-specific DNA recombinase
VQEQRTKEYCEEMGLKLVNTFVITESAKKSQDRVKYHEAMEFVKTNKYGNIIFYMPDRESRNMTDIEENQESVLNGEFNIHYVSERKILHRDSSTTDFMSREFSGLMARDFIRVLRKRITDAMARKAEMGWWPSNHPALGYVCVKNIDPETGKTKSRGTTIGLDPNENNRKIVLLEFELRANGLSYEKIRETVLATGLMTTKKALTYRKSTIEYRLKNPFYRGEFDWKGKRYKGKHELFVPKVWLDKVDDMNGVRGYTKRHIGSEHLALVDGWLKCSCGCNIIYDPKTKNIVRDGGKSKTYHYYRCTNGKGAHKKFDNLQGEKIWEQFGGLLDNISISEEFAQDIAEALNKTENKAHRVAELQIAEFKDKEKELQVREDKLLDLLLNNQIDQKSYERGLQLIRQSREEITNQLAALQKSLTSAVMETAKSVLELATSAKSLWISRSAYERREFLNKVLSNPILDGLTVRYELKKPFAVLLKMNENDNWCSRQDLNLQPPGSKPGALSN